jgi:clan AA aspartic protease
VIVGVVNPAREAIIQLRVRGPTGQERDVDAIVDTGFNGFLTLPPAAVAALGLTWLSRGLATLADGSPTFYDVYEATAIWDGQSITIPVDGTGTTPLVGMELLDGYKLTLEATIGGAVTIEAIP